MAYLLYFRCAGRQIRGEPSQEKTQSSHGRRIPQSTKVEEHIRRGQRAPRALSWTAADCRVQTVQSLRAAGPGIGCAPLAESKPFGGRGALARPAANRSAQLLHSPAARKNRRRGSAQAETTSRGHVFLRDVVSD